MMTAEELKKLDADIAKLRADREEMMTERERLHGKAKAVSVKIRELEQTLPPPKQRRGIMMPVTPARVGLKQRR